MKSFRNTGLFTALIAFTPMAHAGCFRIPNITVVWEPGLASIPSLGSWGLIALALMLAVVGMRLLGNRQSAARYFSAVMAVGVLALGIQTAQTGGAGGFNVSDQLCEGGQQGYAGTSLVDLRNGCSVPLEIVDYIYEDLGTRGEQCLQLQETCPVGTVVAANGDTCPLNYYLNTCDT